MRQTILATLMFVIVGCGTENLPTPTETVVPPVVVVEPPKPVVVIEEPKAEPFCPGEAMVFKTPVSVTADGRVDFRFDVTPDRYLRRGQIEITRTSVAGGRREVMHEFELTGALSGPHNRTATVSVYIKNSGTFSAVGRFHMPNECRLDADGNERANGAWSDSVVFSVN